MKERDKHLLLAAAGLDEKLLDGAPLLAGGQGTLLDLLHGHHMLALGLPMCCQDEARERGMSKGGKREQI